MKPQALIGIVIGVLFNALAMWKGIGVAGAVFGTLGTALLALGLLHVIPAKYQAYVDALEAALVDATNNPKAPALALADSKRSPEPITVKDLPQ